MKDRENIPSIKYEIAALPVSMGKALIIHKAHTLYSTQKWLFQSIWMLSCLLGNVLIY